MLMKFLSALTTGAPFLTSDVSFAMYWNRHQRLSYLSCYTKMFGLFLFDATQSAISTVIFL